MEIQNGSTILPRSVFGSRWVSGSNPVVSAPKPFFHHTLLYFFISRIFQSLVSDRCSMNKYTLKQYAKGNYFYPAALTNVHYNRLRLERGSSKPCMKTSNSKLFVQPHYMLFLPQGKTPSSEYIDHLNLPSPHPCKEVGHSPAPRFPSCVGLQD